MKNNFLLGFLLSFLLGLPVIACASGSEVVKPYPNAAVTTPVLWSSNSSWASFGATKPVAGSAVTIPAGVHIILDETPPALASLTINGTLEFAYQDLGLTSGWIMVMGTMQVGTATRPYANRATITLTATNVDEQVMGMGTRGIMVMGGKLDLHGVPPTRHVTKLNDHAAAGSTTLSLADAVSWRVSDQIVIATSDYYGAGTGSAQRTSITAINGTTVEYRRGFERVPLGQITVSDGDGHESDPRHVTGKPGYGYPNRTGRKSRSGKPNPQHRGAVGGRCAMAKQRVWLPHHGHENEQHGRGSPSQWRRDQERRTGRPVRPLSFSLAHAQLFGKYHPARRYGTVHPEFHR